MSKKQIGQLATAALPLLGVIAADIGWGADFHHYAAVAVAVAAAFGITITLKDDEEIKTP